jgi:uncharacterized protein (DUF983 family)
MTDQSRAPQFATAEYSTKPQEIACKSCGQKISSAYYRVSQAPVCTACLERLQQQLPRDSHQAFVRGLLFGVGAAVVGLGIYAGFAIATGLVIGFVSLAVGYLVGKAIVMGSRGVGGRRYQIAAVALTYIAVSLAAVPIALSVHMQHRQQHPQASAASVEPAAAPASAPAPRMSPAKALGTLTMLGLASPFLDFADPMHGVIGLIILLVGMRIAWQLTAARRLNISGPVPLAGRAPSVSG